MHNKPNFSDIHEQHVLSHILQLVRRADQQWHDKMLRIEAMQTLLDCLRKCSLHPSSLVQEQAKLVPLIRPDEESYHHFIGIFVALERAYSKGVVDSDFVVETTDHTSRAVSKIPCFVICDNIRSAHNVGAIIRTAECFGIETLYLCGYTSTPDNEKTKKTAMGCADYIDWQWQPHVTEVISQLRQNGVYIYALETAQKSTNLFETSLKFPCALVLGNERFGIDDSILQQCDEILRIPMAGVKNSLNIAAAFSIAAAECTRQIQSNSKN